jgi:hypothetical protein
VRNDQTKVVHKGSKQQAMAAIQPNKPWRLAAGESKNTSEQTQSNKPTNKQNDSPDKQTNKQTNKIKSEL